MSGIDGNKPPSEVLIDENDDWVIVKKQRITILIPPSSPAATSLQDDMRKISSEQTCSAKKSMENCDAARKKHPKQMTTNKAQEPLLEGMKVSANIKKAQENATSSHRPVSPVVKANHASIQGQFHENIEKAGNSFGNIYKEELPVISSQVTHRIMRARLLERRVAGFGGLKNWLFTCGFGWFVDILDSEKLGMYQIVSLTMNQLKDMGLDAVGPRRKLIHAIESVSQPNEFEMFS
uniref:SAM domain-containing protein n=1 Tax=Oryza punctata TaxID=4537 RepID=A0A0E0LUG0_ORYPU